ncbi:MAG: hypothetical protein COY53_02935 [Elusimicrobia bacterium CG_4_10_14_0_8_um_filter_37_32]|nr:MAG: hypothetical protein COS17_08775 [Elusimicrobia bacterium CG02_land_8_20_14_3_00_37_13]PIZ13799.1 MAG: hypothetical protein COY53_02935 [Elusimicrobia bacterium CG_4_10_14_0_8_um_filter_37_32]
MKVLVIDDDKEIHDMLEVFLQSLGHECYSSLTVADGLKQVAVTEPDLVLLDIRLPDEDGIEVLKEIKQINKRLPVIMVTGYKDAEKVIDAFRFGATDCLLKPFNFDYLKNLLGRVKMGEQGLEP